MPIPTKNPTKNVTLNWAIATIQWMDDHKTGEIYTVGVIKRMDGTVRWMNCKSGVKPKDKLDAQGNVIPKKSGPAYDPFTKRLVWVYDMQKEAHRSINLDGIFLLRHNHKDFVVKGMELKYEEAMRQQVLTEFNKHEQ